MLDYRVNTFLTLYREMNYRRTAEQLNMTQPGVTQHIHCLEKRYGVRLFTYEGRTLRRTREAELFKRHLDSVLAEEQAMRGEFSARQGVTLNVGATKTVGEFVLPGVVERFLDDPGHSLNFIIDNTRNLLALLERNELDFAVIEGVIDKERYGYRLYKKEKFLGICGAAHPFAGRVVSLSELFDQTLYIREKGSGTRRLFEQAVNDRGYSLDRFQRVASLSSFGLMTNLLTKGEGITFAYQPVAHQRPGLATFQVADMRIEGEFNFVYCNRAIGEEKIQLFFGKQA